MYYYHNKQIDDFLTAVHRGTKPLVDGYEGRRTVELIEAIYRATATGSVVRFPLK